MKKQLQRRALTQAKASSSRKPGRPQGGLAQLQAHADVSSVVHGQLSIQHLADNRALQPAGFEEDELQAVQRAPAEEEELAQGKGLQLAALDEEMMQGKALQREPSSSSSAVSSQAATGAMPQSLKSGVEALSGMSMDSVQVHRNSAEPAEVGARAFAQGSDIHLGPGQEQHLPHEAWHVVQQAEGRVQPTTSVSGRPVNDDPGLEAEADRMGAASQSAGDRLNLESATDVV